MIGAVVERVYATHGERVRVAKLHGRVGYHIQATLYGSGGEVWVSIEQMDYLSNAHKRAIAVFKALATG